MHKKLLLVIIVIVPMFWLLFTDDGKRRSDTLILWIMGGDPIDLNFKILDRKYTMQDWNKVFNDIDWHCKKKTSAFGDALCYSDISSYNGIPAYYLSVFFQHDHVNAVKLVYRNQYHQQIGMDLQQQLGSYQLKSHENVQDDMLEWQTEYGTVLLKKILQPEEQATLIWLAKKL